MEMQGFAQRQLDAPYKPTTKDRLVIQRPDGEKAYEVMFVRKEGLVLKQLGMVGLKPIKLDWPSSTISPNSTDVKVFSPTGQYVPREDASPLPGTDAAPKRTKPADGESKIAKCKAFYTANKTLTREAMQLAFVERFGCTKQGANTYFLTCQRELGALIPQVAA